MNVKDILKKRMHEVIIVLCILIYTVVFSYNTCLKHYTFHSYSWDLGVFNQAIYTTIYEGKFFYYTPDLFMNPEGSYFAIHFSPILLLILPLYALLPSVQTL